MKLIVNDTQIVAREVMRICLRPVDGGQTVFFEPGAHLKFRLPSGMSRAYSLIGDGHPGLAYEIAVLRTEGGVGSAWMHSLARGDEVQAELGNAFALEPCDAGHVLIAGGIGITPILGMARRLSREGKPYALHYAGKNVERMAFREEVMALGGQCYDTANGGLRPRLVGLLAGVAECDVYVCGPASLIDAVVAYGKQAGWPEGRVHYELFEGSLSQVGDQPFEVELRQSGLTLHVASDENVMTAMMAAGIEPLYDCKRGECGMCLTPVLEGVPDHRDHYLSSAERARNDVMCVCVSRSRTPILVLDV